MEELELMKCENGHLVFSNHIIDTSLNIYVGHYFGTCEFCGTNIERINEWKKGVFINFEYEM